VDDRTNTMIISEVPGRIQLLDRLIDTLDEATPQVSIEARIIESNVNAAEAFGVQWGYNMVADAAYGNQTSLSFPNSIQIGGNQISNIQNPGLIGPLGGYAINLPAQGRTSGTVFSFGNVANTFRLDMAISALQRKGKVKIISSPRTTTQNNMEATITQGRQIPVQTIQNNTVTVRFQPAALELKVTPQITARGDVICTLDIQNNAADFANLVNGIPPIITQSTATTIRVPDGQTIAIGGLYRVENAVTREGVPLLSKIPILGSLFRNRSVSGDKRELLIFVTPRIIK
jgi:type IV pilus assembly protein PilQ